jgi:hypothetical protein
MKLASLLGILLVLMGGLALAYQVIGYAHLRTLSGTDPAQAAGDTQERIRVRPVLGDIALLGGAVFLIVGSRQRV